MIKSPWLPPYRSEYDPEILWDWGLEGKEEEKGSKKNSGPPSQIVDYHITSGDGKIFIHDYEDDPWD